MLECRTRSALGFQMGSLTRPGARASAYASASGWVELRVLRVQPRLVVVRILEGERRFRHLEWTERIHHHRQLLGVLRPDARFGAARVRTMRYPIWMMGDAA